MEYVKLGHTGMDVSKICLGTMGFGDPNSGFNEWALGEKESLPVIKKALELALISLIQPISIHMEPAKKFLGKH